MKNKSLASVTNYGIIIDGATFAREAGQGRNPAALSDDQVCALFFNKHNVQSFTK